MSPIITIFRKELRGYLGTPYGWIILAFVMFLQGISLSATLKVFQIEPQKEGILFFILHAPTFWFYFLFIFPLITMRTLAEEEKTGTLESLLTAPLKTPQVVIGKYLAAYVFFMILWLPLILYPLLGSLANVYVSIFYDYTATMDTQLSYRMCDWVGSYAILFLMGAWFTSIGILCSSLTSSQLISGITTIGTLLCIYFLGLVPLIWGEFPASGIFHYISSVEHLDRFTAGLIDTRPLVFYASMTILTLALTFRIVDYRRWKR